MIEKHFVILQYKTKRRVTMGKFDKKEYCEYCEEKMNAVYRNKRFCSAKCRVYFNRENHKLILNKTEKGEVVKKEKIISEVLVKKEMTKAELLKLMRGNGEF
jgi:hypothetical protein